MKKKGRKIISKFIDLTGMQFGKLKVIDISETIINKYGKNIVMWNCICQCGNEVIASGRELRRGHKKSCGCLKFESPSKRFKKYNKYDLSGQYGIGYTSKGEEFYFDKEDYELINKYCWYIDNIGYVATGGSRGFRTRLHEFIMNSSEACIDHHDGNKNNNCKCNLRPTTNQNNVRNGIIRNTNKSGYIGVHWSKKNCNWVAQITINYKNIYLTSSNNINDAITARLKAEKEYFGEYAPQKHLFEQYNI